MISIETGQGGVLIVIIWTYTFDKRDDDVIIAEHLRDAPGEEMTANVSVQTRDNGPLYGPPGGRRVPGQLTIAFEVRRRENPHCT